MNEACKHKFVFLRSKSSHEGACYHVGSCLLDEFFCQKCGHKTGGEFSQKIVLSSGTSPQSLNEIKDL